MHKKWKRLDPDQMPNDRTVLVSPDGGFAMISTNDPHAVVSGSNGPAVTAEEAEQRIAGFQNVLAKPKSGLNVSVNWKV